MKEIQRDLTRTVLAVLCIILLMVASFWVLRPFLAATVWATMIVVATWPLLEALEVRFGGRRTPAVALMTLAMLLLLVLPIVLAVGTIAEHAGSMVELVRGLAAAGDYPRQPLPPRPARRLPQPPAVGHDHLPGSRRRRPPNGWKRRCGNWSQRI